MAGNSTKGENVTRTEANIALFSYGTLQLPQVQLANYGRLLRGEPDELSRYMLADIMIGDEAVIGISGTAAHRIARHTGDSADRVEGTVLFLTAAELEATDLYETDAYQRVEVMLESGRAAFAYVEAPAK